ncbi:hypothetical protein [Halococcus sediminicola]|uniref:hypothetical protein n=1 Tax=Halococcus sediminicola TaxID=1264579 RepID=UPI000679D028|nr:hypothetical protein [Halococcus sediminicola]
MASPTDSPDYDLEHLKEQGLAQKVKNVDTGEQYYRLRPDAIQKHKHLIQHDDQVAMAIFGLYLNTAKQETEKEIPEILHEAGLIYRDTCSRNLFRLIDDSEINQSWDKIVDQLSEEYIAQYDP